MITIRATYDCTYWPDPEPDTDPAQWGGWCDPSNPWGTADDTYDEHDTADAYGRGEPIDLVMTPAEAIDFLVDFPGSIWDTYIECDPSQDYRTGVYTTVIAHIEGPEATTVLDAAVARMKR